MTLGICNQILSAVNTGKFNTKPVAKQTLSPKDNPKGLAKGISSAFKGCFFV
jgi:hypothetical protein